MIAGTLLFLMQMHGDQHTANPNEFELSTNLHIQNHYNNDVPSGDQFDQPPVDPPKGTPPQP